MHYHIADPQPNKTPRSWQRLLGWLFLAIFVALVAVVWLPYGLAMASGGLVTILPPAWGEAYANATLPATAKVTTGNKLIIKTKELNIEAPIVRGIEPKDLLNGVGHDPASVKPGQQGRSIISGHRFWLDPSPWARVFFNLDKLKVGDKITVLYEGEAYSYTVTEAFNVPKKDVKPQLDGTTEPILTIYTCGPTPYSAKNRLGFHAKLDQSHLKQGATEAIQSFQEVVL